MKRNRNRESDEQLDDVQYESPASEFSSSGYFTPQAQTTDYETPSTPIAGASEEEDSDYRRLSDHRDTLTEGSSTMCSINDLLSDTAITHVPESSEVYLLGPTVTKVADENGKLIKPETIIIKPEPIRESNIEEPGGFPEEESQPTEFSTQSEVSREQIDSGDFSRQETPHASREALNGKAYTIQRAPVDVDSDFSNTSIRSAPPAMKDSQSSENLQKPSRPTSLGLSFDEELLAFQEEKTNGLTLREIPDRASVEGFPDAIKKSDTEAVESVPAQSPISPQKTLNHKSRDSSISSLLESQVSNTDSDSALHEPEPQRKPFSLIAPKPYTKERPKLGTVTTRDALPSFPLSDKSKTEGLFPPPPSPASSVSNLTGEPVKAPAVVETSPRLRKDSLEKRLPAVPSLGSPVVKERKAMLDSDSITKPLPSDLVGKEKQEHLYKVLVIGELGTGKTSIIKRYVHEFFSQHYRATIGVDFALKVLHWNENTVIRLQLWDIAGQERFNNMTRVYYKEAVGALIVFDVTRAATFDAVMKWKQDLDSKVTLPDGSPIPCLLLANKCDQPKEGIANHPAKLDEFCKEKGFIGWYETSAKDNVNIDDAAKCLVSKILENDHWQENEPQDTTKVSLEARQEEKNKKMSCC